MVWAVKRSVWCAGVGLEVETTLPYLADVKLACLPEKR
jgi:hypothetical protein